MLINLRRIREGAEGTPPPDLPPSTTNFSQKLEGKRAGMTKSSKSPPRGEQKGADNRQGWKGRQTDSNSLRHFLST